MKAVLLAGGEGKRLAPYTTVLPKPLLPVSNKPILEIIIQQLVSHGVKEIVLCVGYLQSLIEAYFGDGSKFGVSISYLREKNPLGTAGPLALLGKMSEPFLVMNGDILSSINYGEMMARHKKNGDVVTIGVAKKDVKIDLGVLELNGDHTLDKYVEKPVLSYHVSMGIYVFDPSVVEFVSPSKRLDMPDLIMKLKGAKKKISAYESNCEWLDMGTPSDYAKAQDIFEEKRKLFLK